MHAEAELLQGEIPHNYSHFHMWFLVSYISSQKRTETYAGWLSVSVKAIKALLRFWIYWSLWPHRVLGRLVVLNQLRSAYWVCFWHEAHLLNSTYHNYFLNCNIIESLTKPNNKTKINKWPHHWMSHWLCGSIYESKWICVMHWNLFKWT